MSGSFIWKWTKDRVRESSEGCDYFRGSESSESLERTACTSRRVFAFQTPKSPYEMLTMRSLCTHCAHCTHCTHCARCVFFSGDGRKEQALPCRSKKDTNFSFKHLTWSPSSSGFELQKLPFEPRRPGAYVSDEATVFHKRLFIYLLFIFQSLIFPEAFRKCCAVTLHRQFFLVPTAPS